jgi:hypothetical protein
MKRRIGVIVAGAALMGTVILAGCNSDEREDADAEVVIENAEPESVAELSPQIEREFWLAIAEEPGGHLDQARELYMAGDLRGAAADLIKVASMLKFESRHSHSQDEAQPLLLAVEELREVASLIRSEEKPENWVPDTKALDRVSARTFRALGAHHLALARESMDGSDGLMAGRYILESAHDIAQGFARAGVGTDAVMEKDLSDARTLAGHLIWEGDGDRAEAQAALDRLADAMNGLGEVLGSRRI